MLEIISLSFHNEVIEFLITTKGELSRVYVYEKKFKVIVRGQLKGKMPTCNYNLENMQTMFFEKRYRQLVTNSTSVTSDN